MQTRCPRSRISPLFCGVCPTTAIFPEQWGPGRSASRDIRRKGGPWLAGQRQVGLVAGVDEDVRVRLVVLLTAVEEGAVQPGHGPRMLDTVGPQRLLASVRKPGVEVVLPFQGGQEHLFVIA